MIRTYRYPLRPTKAQEAVLITWIDRCRVLYNAALEERRTHYKRFGKGVTRYDQQKSLTIIRAEDPSYAEVPAVVLRSALDRLDKAYKAFFRRVKAGETPGYPRFKGKDRFDSFALMGSAKIKNSKVHILKIGPVKFHEYRPLKGKPLDVRIKRETNGWFLLIQVDLGESPPKNVDLSNSVGIDLGLKEFAVLSNGEAISNPRFGRGAQEELAKRQRVMARRKRGSRSRARAKVLVAKAHLHIKNQRLDFCRKTAKSLVDRFDVVSHEELQIKNMVRGTLARSINDAAWGQFIQCLVSKAEEAGKLVIGVDPRGTTQECSRCGGKVSKGLSQRTHDCPHCGLTLDRDHNAALNIQRRGQVHTAKAFSNRQAMAGCT